MLCAFMFLLLANQFGTSTEFVFGIPGHGDLLWK
jgi:hypothetical protein